MLKNSIVSSIYKLLMQDSNISQKYNLNLLEYFFVSGIFSLRDFIIAKKTVNKENCYYLFSTLGDFCYLLKIENSLLSWEDSVTNYFSNDFVKSIGLLKFNDNGNYNFNIDTESSIFKNLDMKLSCNQDNINSVKVRLFSNFMYRTNPAFYNELFFKTLISLCIDDFDVISVNVKHDLRKIICKELNIEIDIVNKQTFIQSLSVVDMLLI